MGAAVSPITSVEFDQLPERPEVKAELLDGELVEMGRAKPSLEVLKATINKALLFHLASHPAGEVYPETMYRVDGENSFIPDLSFVRAERVPLLSRDDYWPYPDLAIEIISPSESAELVERKVRRYLAAGTSSVWIVFQKPEFVRVFRPGGFLADFEHGQTLTEPHLLPDFGLPIDELYHR
jgi:Uma2 family endonuclease